MMKGKRKLSGPAPAPTARATLTSLPQEVLDIVVNCLHGNDKSHLALCCKATLPILCMGHVTLNTDKHQGERPLLQAAHCLTNQPSGVSHLEVWSRSVDIEDGTRRVVTRFVVSAHNLNLSPLSNLRKLTLGRVKVPLPTLQTVATRLRELHVHGSYLQGSADGFLTKGWTALTSLSLVEMRMENGMLTAALELPALEDVRICEYDSCESDRSELQLDQLTASCPQVSRLEFQLNNRFQEASRQSYRLLNLKQLADLRIRSWPKANVDLDLPPSLTQLRLGGYPGGGRNSVDFFWALLEAAKCAGRGAQLHRLICDCTEAYLQPAQWGASLDEQHRRLGVQLGCLRELEISGAQEQLLSAVGAVASAAPSLVSLKVTVTDSPPWVEVSPICSASLQSIRVEWGHTHRPELPAPRVLLTFLPGCTRLQEVIVHFMGQPVEGATVKIRCHCCSQRCIEPVYGYARFYNETPEEVYAGAYNDIFVKFLHRPSPEQGVHEYTVLYSCHAAEPEQRPLCFHAVLPGGL